METLGQVPSFLSVVMFTRLTTRASVGMEGEIEGEEVLVV